MDPTASLHVCGREKSRTPAGIRTALSSPQTRHYTDYTIPTPSLKQRLMIFVNRVLIPNKGERRAA